MPVEIVGQQLRIRVRSPSLFKKGSYGTLNFGKEGKIQEIRARLKSNGKWDTQALRFNLNKFRNRPEILEKLTDLYYDNIISESKYYKARKLIQNKGKYFDWK